MLKQIKTIRKLWSAFKAIPFLFVGLIMLPIDQADAKIDSILNLNLKPNIGIWHFHNRVLAKTFGNIEYEYRIGNTTYLAIKQMHMLFPWGLKVSVPHLPLSLIPSLNLSAWRRSAPQCDLPSRRSFSSLFDHDLGYNWQEISPGSKMFLSQIYKTNDSQEGFPLVTWLSRYHAAYQICSNRGSGW